MNKIFGGVLGVLAIALLVSGGYYMLREDSPKSNELTGANGDNESYTQAAAFFAERLPARAIEMNGGNMPIEGFDAELYAGIYQGLTAADFHNVRTDEGIYAFVNGELTFKRTRDDVITTAEKTINAEGHATLLENLGRRLNMPITTEAEVSAIINKISELDNPPLGLEDNPGGVAARKALATRLNIHESEVVAVNTEEAIWPNGCLGLAREGEICTEAIVQGFKITLAAQGKTYVYRTDERGTNVRATN